MIRRFIRHVGTAMRLLVPTPARWLYGRTIRKHRLLDREFYFASNPSLPLLCRIFPERHYVLRGEPLGLCPSPQFSPRAYAFLNPDVAGSGLAPLQHYLAKGLAEHRLARDLPLNQMPPHLLLQGQGALQFPLLSRRDAPPAAAFAVVLHLYYPSLWPEMAQRLGSQSFAFDLFVTLSGDDSSTAALAARIRADFPQAQIWAMPNHGRDIFPFLHLLNAGLLAPYQAVCKLHGKKSPHRSDGDAWRQDLIAGVLGQPQITAARLERFTADAQAGLWVADGHLCCGPRWWGSNCARTTALLARADISFVPDNLCFAAGSIYWIKPALLHRLGELQLEAGDFEPEMGQVDGTTAHALERGLGLIAADTGLAIRQSSDLDADLP
jgi:lipopolysaccharide biosynthesis protein